MAFLTDFTITDPNAGRISVVEQIFKTNGTWTVPAGVTGAQVILVGGGAGGGQSTGNSAGGGGGGGAVVTRNLQVTPGQTFNIAVGAGGQGGAGPSTAYQDYTLTLPGANGGTTTFGTGSAVNLLQNTTFDFSILGWENTAFIRYFTATLSTTTASVYPNTQGIQVGMYVTGTNIPANTTVTAVNVATSQITLSAAIVTANTAGLIYFNWVEQYTSQVSVVYPAISGTVLPAVNTQLANKPSTPDFRGLSNNIWLWNNTTMEDPYIVTNGYVRSRGTNPATIQITNVNVPTRLAEMQWTLTRTGVAITNGSNVLTGIDTTQLQPGMYLTSASGIPAGTVINSIDNPTQITMSANATATVATASFTVGFNPAGSASNYCLYAAVPSAVTPANPTWLTLTTYNNGALSSGGTQAIPVMPGQTYTMSAYIAVNTNVSTTSPISFQLRGVNYTNAPDVNTSYLGGTTSLTTSTVDNGTANGFFVRQVTPTVMTNFGDTKTQTVSFAQNATTLTVADTSGILPGMAVVGAGIQANTTVTAVNSSTKVVTISLSTASVQSSITITFQMPTNVQVLADPGVSPVYRRVSATFTMPSVVPGTRTNGQLLPGDNPFWVVPHIVFTQGNVNVWMGNFQLEAGTSAGVYQVPMQNARTAVRTIVRTANGGNLETSHRYTKINAGAAYSGSMFVVSGGTSTSLRPVQAYIEWFDSSYNSLGRVAGNSNYLPQTGVRAYDQTWGFEYLAHPVRVAIENQVAPTGSVYAKFGYQVINGATSATAGQVEYYMFAPQFELGTVITNFRDPNNTADNVVWSGQAGMSPIITAPLASAEGGGGGGTYNSTNLVWQYGLPGANWGGHTGPYWSNTAGKDNPNYAGGGGGAGSAGGHGLGNSGVFSHNTGAAAQANSTIAWTGYYQPAGIQNIRGNLGGYGGAIWGPSDQYQFLFGGDGGLGMTLTGIGGGSSTGILFGGGGGGGGWNWAGMSTPGRGNSGGGKGGATNLYQPYNSADYFARGMDAIPNTGGGGGGGGHIQSLAWDSTLQHSSYTYLTNETQADNTRWLPLYNTQINIVGSGYAGSNSMRMTALTAGNSKMVTAFPIAVLPRTEYIFYTPAAILRNAPVGITSATNASQAKRIRFSVRWKDQNNQLISEERAPDMIFTSVGAWTFFGTGAPAAYAPYWQTKKAPDQAAWMEYAYEFLYADAGDYADVDMSSSGVYYYAYRGEGGNGADGMAIVRYFVKAAL